MRLESGDFKKLAFRSCCARSTSLCSFWARRRGGMAGGFLFRLEENGGKPKEKAFFWRNGEWGGFDSGGGEGRGERVRCSCGCGCSCGGKFMF